MPKNEWGPDRKRAAVSLTFDNLGEAAEIELGALPEDVKTGAHGSVTEALPCLLEILEGTTATFFVESWNVEHYPEAIRSIQSGGHEVANHGYRHEVWGQLDRDQEGELFERCLATLDTMGIKPKGFRPPGGQLTTQTKTLLHDLGFTYLSPAGRTTRAEEGLATLPFDWKLVDAYFLDEGLGALRNHFGDPNEAFPLSAWEESLDRAIEETKSKGTHLVTIFHPFLFIGQPERYDLFSRTVERLSNDPEVWLAPCQEVAQDLATKAPPSP